jgi:two-component system chemotaxis sensor kinase CheA
MSASDPAATFRQEAQELLEVLEQALLDLEHAPGDTDLVDSAFRALHTIKGSGAMFGFDAVAGFTHHVETAFDLVRKGKVDASPGLIAVALSAKDRMRLLIEHPETTDTAAGDEILLALKLIIEGAPAPPPAAEPPSTTWRIHFRLAENAMAMGTNPLLLLDELRSLGTATVTALTDAIPKLDRLVPTDCHIGWDVILSTSKPRSAIEDVFLFVIDEAELTITAIDTAGEADRLGEILIDRGTVRPEVVASALASQLPLGTLLVQAGDLNQDKLAAALAEQEHVRAGARAAKAADSIRVPAERLDELMDRVGELMIAQSRLTQVAAGSSDVQVKAVAEEIERLAVELRDTTMGVRTLPIGSLFGRFRRLVHDLAQELGKQIELTTVGEETELDKTMIERLNDPLIHLIRNAIDHGLELPDARSAASKPVAGHITLSARHAGAEVLVSIADDGSGLDRARIQARAEEQGLLSPGAKLSDGELFQILFQPGFSTAREVTSLSGGHQPVRPRRRHGRGQARHRGPARQDRRRQRAGQRHHGHAAPAADAGDHRRAAGAGRRRPLCAAAVRRRGMRRTLGRGGCAFAGPQFPQRARRSRAVPAAARTVPLGGAGRPLPESGDRVVWRAPGRAGRRPGDRQPPDRHQIAVETTQRHGNVLRRDHPGRRRGGPDPRYRRAGRFRPGARAPAAGRELKERSMTTWNGGHSLEVLTLALQGEIFALEVTHVREILDLVPITEVPNSQRFLNGLINVRGKVVPLADLRLKFGMEPTPPTIDTRIVVVEVEVDGDPVTVGLRADKVFEITEVAAASLEETPRIGMRWRSEFIRCIGKRGSEFIVVLDIGRIFSRADPRETAVSIDHSSPQLTAA